MIQVRFPKCDKLFYLDESISNLFKRTNIGSKGLQNAKKLNLNLETMVSSYLPELIQSFHFDNYNFQFFLDMFNKILKLYHGV